MWNWQRRFWSYKYCELASLASLSARSLPCIPECPGTPLVKYTTVFQVETYAILRCASILNILENTGEVVVICSDSQSAIKALHKPRVTSKLTRECIKELNELATNRAVWLTWVPGHSGIQGNERADEPARQASSQSLVGPEPALPISHTVIKTAIRDWAYKQNDKRWRGLTTCRQAKEMISGRCRRRERDLLALPRQILRLVVGILLGHTQVGRNLSIMGLNEDPLCNYCCGAEESASHFLCHCDDRNT